MSQACAITNWKKNIIYVYRVYELCLFTEIHNFYLLSASSLDIVFLLMSKESKHRNSRKQFRNYFRLELEWLFKKSLYLSIKRLSHALVAYSTLNRLQSSNFKGKPLTLLVRVCFVFWQKKHLFCVEKKLYQNIFY